MSSIAFLFAGQGVDLLPAAHAFCGASAQVEHWFDRAAQAAGNDRAGLFAKGGRALSSTRVAQPALVALCLGVWCELARSGIRADYVAGHSLGELAAWSALGAINPEQAIDLAAERARLMEREAKRSPGGMLALVDVSEASVTEALRLGQTRGALTIAARNAPGEWVLSGEKPALSLVASRFRSVPIQTEGAWHSPAMVGAVQDLCRALQRAPQQMSSVRLIDSGTGAVIERQSEIPELLARHLVEPIDWIAVLRTLRVRGVRHFVTVGPGKVMRGLVRKNLGSELSILSTETPRELQQTIGQLSR
jgi:[acyl-carrier-protein] S-malonyltransferase